MSVCRICAGSVREFLDFGRQPLSDAFLLPEQLDTEFFFRLAVGICETCTMVQLMVAISPMKHNNRAVSACTRPFQSHDEGWEV